MTQQDPERQPHIAQATPPVHQETLDEPQAQPDDDPAAAAPASAPKPEPSPQPAPQVQPAQPQSNVVDAEQTTQRDVLPETAGVGVGLGFIGISLLAGAATLRATRNRKS